LKSVTAPADEVVLPSEEETEDKTEA